jgi:DnaJ-class molecular chaperone
VSDRRNLPDWGTRPKPCDACHGTGVLRYIRTCGSFEPDPCPTCLGNGQILQIVPLAVAVPPSLRLTSDRNHQLSFTFEPLR